MLIDILGNEVGKFVEEQREKQNISIRQLAKLADVAPNSIMTIENGKPIREKTVVKVLSALGYQYEIIKQPKVKFSEIKTIDSKKK